MNYKFFLKYLVILLLSVNFCLRFVACIRVGTAFNPLWIVRHCSSDLGTKNVDFDILFYKVILSSISLLICALYNSLSQTIIILVLNEINI